MGPMDVLNNLLAEFGALIGIPELELDEESRCNLMFDEVAVSVELSPDGEAVYIYAYLGDVVGADSAAVLALLLEANYLFRGTQGATIGRDEASGRVVMMRAENLSNMSLSQFQSLLDEFVNLAELWINKLANFSAIPEAQSPAPTPVDALTTRV